jgi:hypothetical protein
MATVFFPAAGVLGHCLVRDKGVLERRRLFSWFVGTGVVLHGRSTLRLLSLGVVGGEGVVSPSISRLALQALPPEIVASRGLQRLWARGHRGPWVRTRRPTMEGAAGISSR